MTIRASKLERIDAALVGGTPDVVPFSAWYHFGLHHLPGHVHAEAELSFFDHYDLDFLKVMNDYMYPLPSGMHEVTKPSDWHRLKAVDPWGYRGYSEQLTALKIIGSTLKDRAYFIDTIFSPWTVARNLAWKHHEAHRKENSDDFLAGLSAITENLRRFVRAAIDVGASGIFYSIAGASEEYMSEEEYERFGKPFDLMVLEAAKGAHMNVLHIHGSRAYFDLVKDYPVRAINWSDRDATNPTLAKARTLTPKCLMGGIDEVNAKEMTTAELKQQIADAVAQTKGRGFICTPGCSVKTNVYEHSIRAMAEACHKTKLA
jgi:uroporphyrinogen decarboxylase